MKNFVKLASIALILLIVSINAQAQTATGNNTLTMGIPAIALLATDVAAVSLELTTAVAGEQVSGGEGTTHVQISSIIGTGLTRKLTASVTGVPVGTSLKVSTTIPGNGNEGGTVGTGSTDMDLINAAAAVDLVTGIGSCFTGVLADDGYTLDYTWNAGSVANYGLIEELSGGTSTVVLTLTEDGS